MNLVKPKWNIEYKMLLVKRNSENTLKSGLLILMPLDWSLLISFSIFLSIYVYSLFDIINLAPISIILCCFELGGVCGCGGVCVCV